MSFPNPDPNDFSTRTRAENVLNRTEGQIPGPFSNDSEAELGGVKLGNIYKKTDGSVVWRME